MSSEYTGSGTLHYGNLDPVRCRYSITGVALDNGEWDAAGIMDVENVGILSDVFDGGPVILMMRGGASVEIVPQLAQVERRTLTFSVRRYITSGN